MSSKKEKRTREPLSLEKEALRRALDITKRMRGLVKVLSRIEQLGFSKKRRIHIPFRLDLDPGKDLEGAGALVESLREAVRVERVKEQAIVLGRTYCFRCDTSLCGHACPKDPREVFAGYSPTGMPLWADFVSWCIDRRDPRLSALLEGSSHVMAYMVPGRELHKDQLPVFGAEDKRYRILGQVVAGLFRLNGPDGKALDAASSFQIVMVRNSDGKPELLLNSVSGADLLGKGDPALSEILGTARKALDLISIRMEGIERNGKLRDPEELVVPVLKGLIKDIEHHSKGFIRRTGHGRLRSMQGERPTEMAYPEARKATDVDILVDTLEGTIVVLGHNNRVHVFTRDGKHITSLRVRGDSIRKRIQSGRWRGADPAERGTFRGGLRALEAFRDRRERGDE